MGLRGGWSWEAGSLGPRDKWAADMNFWILREGKVGDQDSCTPGGRAGWEAEGVGSPDSWGWAGWELGIGGAGLGGP